MNANVGTPERAIRLLVGIAFAAIAMFGGFSTPLQIGLYAFAAVMVLTAAVSFCPLWSMIGVNTCRR